MTPIRIIGWSLAGVAVIAAVGFAAMVVTVIVNCIEVATGW
jgi:hypothetical protein